ncbi:Protein of unknown function [Polynucleobacter meluiroseus]|uniref:Uncharacterized protein n=1 Tax=Polynucleobacter meluiroseus TaxID=1938814 RepID=A0A240DZ21_9BURK|nr:DUF2946 family protein [Polynucleobacter meluiroseus]SNX27924.1 Protein of unknown function [Polynucleobacter meluiroseus]
MDEMVLRSIIKWPDVPDCFGWLALDRRGQWRMRDEYAQAHQLPGTVIAHTALNDYIARNYGCDSEGRYFFQNGPQRVFIFLEVAPWIARFSPTETGLELLTQCHTSINPQGALSDERGNIYIIGHVPCLFSEKLHEGVFIERNHLSVCLLLDHDLDQFSELAELRESACSFEGSWNWNGQRLPLDPILSKELSERFHFVKSPDH